MNIRTNNVWAFVAVAITCLALNENVDATISECRFQRNTAAGSGSDDRGGGGLFNRESDSTLTNCIFLLNRAKNNTTGGGVYNYSSVSNFANCTFFSNESDLHGASIYSRDLSNSTINNSIMWRPNSPATEMSKDGTSKTTVRYSNVKGGFEGTGNISADPLFSEQSDLDNLDFHLKENSPCIDAADGDVAPKTDMDGKGRVDVTDISDKGWGQPSYVDMGAYELQP